MLDVLAFAIAEADHRFVSGGDKWHFVRQELSRSSPEPLSKDRVNLVIELGVLAKKLY